MIDGAAADRVESWTRRGGRRRARRCCSPAGAQGNVLTPGLLADVPRDAKVSCKEIFGPVSSSHPIATGPRRWPLVNDSDFGLQAGIFTHDVTRIFSAFNGLEVGGVIVNDFPTLRVDNFPYGGVKDSGFGREGVRYAMEEMSEPRMLVLNLNR